MLQSKFHTIDSLPTLLNPMSIKSLKLIYTIPLVFLMGIGVIGQVGYSPNIGTNLSSGGGGGGGGVGAGACPAGQVMTAVSIGLAPTCVSTLDAGTLTASAPFTFTQTWNNGAVVFQGLNVRVLETASDAFSSSFQVFGGAAGTTSRFCVGPCNDGTADLAVNTVSGEVISNRQFTLHNTMLIDAGRFFCTSSGGGCFHFKTLGDFSIGNNGGTDDISLNVNAIAIGSFGSGATVSGNSSVGRVTVGTSPGATGTLTFAVAYETNAPHCDAINETTGIVIPAVATTGGVTFTGTFTAGNAVSYRCTGWHAQ